MNLREIWRAIVLYGLFAVLVITGFHELPDGESILPVYIIIASAAVPFNQKPRPLGSANVVGSDGIADDHANPPAHASYVHPSAHA